MIKTDVKGELRVWNGEKNRPLRLCTPCPCGCDGRQTREQFGYLTASDHEGNGFTLWLSEEDYCKLRPHFLGVGHHDEKES